MKRIFFVFSFLISSCVIFRLPYEEKEKEFFVGGDEKAKDKILIINIDGIIDWSERERRFFGPAEGSIVEIVKKNLEHAEDERIKAILLKISSPGGLVSASEAIYNEIVRFKERSGKKVISYFEDIGTSGAYYIACAGDYLISSPGAILGSIGVIALKINIKGLMGKIGVEYEGMKSGEKKDMISILRPMTEEEKGILSQILSEYHENFKSKVRKSRKNIKEEVFDARILSPQKAKELGLIDEIGDIYFALKKTEELAGLKSSKWVVFSKRKISNIYSKAYSQNEITDLIMKNPGEIIFMY